MKREDLCLRLRGSEAQSLFRTTCGSFDADVVGSICLADALIRIAITDQLRGIVLSTTDIAECWHTEILSTRSLAPLGPISPGSLRAALWSTNLPLPRFLFGRFTDKSGGALLRRFNKRLNMEYRIIPHHFLGHHNGTPRKTLAEYPEENSDHMQKNPVGAMCNLSPFSSWTPPLMAAYVFAGFANDVRRHRHDLIENELYCVDHCSLRGPPSKRIHNRELPWEYHVYGPFSK